MFLVGLTVAPASKNILALLLLDHRMRPRTCTRPVPSSKVRLDRARADGTRLGRAGLRGARRFHVRVGAGVVGLRRFGFADLGGLYQQVWRLIFAASG